MASPSYAELLKDPRWQRKRLEILQRDGWACTECGDKDKSLQVHHLRYRYGAKPWEYEGDLLTTLCEVCHGKASVSVNLLKDALSRLYPSDLDRVRGYVDAMCYSRDCERMRIDNRGEYFIGVAEFLGVTTEDLLQNIDGRDGTIDTTALQLYGSERRKRKVRRRTANR